MIYPEITGKSGDISRLNTLEKNKASPGIKGNYGCGGGGLYIGGG